MSELVRRYGIKSTTLAKQLKKVALSAVYVGIAKGSAKDARDDGPFTNAEIGLVHEFGAPSQNIPPRPFLVPGTKSAKDTIKGRFEEALESALEGDDKGCSAALERCGIEVASAVRSYMTTASFEPLKPATIMHRKSYRNAKSDEERERILTLAKPLIDTGSLRQAIDSFVVEEK